MLNIVLVEPEIPNNTGNIGRLCRHWKSLAPYILWICNNDKNLNVRFRLLGTPRCYWIHWCKRMDESSVRSITFFLMSSHAEKSYLDIEFQDDWLVLVKKAWAWAKKDLFDKENQLKNVIQITFCCFCYWWGQEANWLQ
jgi:tRNA (cytidine/uridine-2'-O-)-methyltransferase